MTSITTEMIDNASDADLLRYQQQLAQEAERASDQRKAELRGAFTQATRYIAGQAESNGHRVGYTEEAVNAREYMPDWLLPWLPDPSVKASGFYVFYAETEHDWEQGDDNLERQYQPSMNTMTGTLNGTRRVGYASMYGEVGEWLERRLPSDLMEQVRPFLPNQGRAEKERQYNLADAHR